MRWPIFPIRATSCSIAGISFLIPSAPFPPKARGRRGFAFPDTDLVEYLTGSPFIDEITVGGWQLDADGMLAIPKTAGLGLELDPEVVRKYTNGEKLL